MRAYDDAGDLLDAIFFVEPSEGRLHVVLESRAGAGRRGVPRNPDYIAALDTILTRLANLGATLHDADVASRVTRDLPPELRRIVDVPLRLDRTTSIEQLRSGLTRSAARVGREPGATGSGNPTKRLRLTVEVPGFGTSDADRMEELLAYAPARPGRFEAEAADLLRDLVGVQLTTVAGRPNRILQVGADTVLVATGRSPNGRAVPVGDVARALEVLDREGSVEIRTETVGFRSAFVGAVLREVPGARVDATTPPKIVLDPQTDETRETSDDQTSPLPAPGPFQGDLDRPVTMRQRREQRKLRRALLAGSEEAGCALCGQTYPARFLWASHIKRRAAATPDEARDLPYVAMLACDFGCDALFEDGYVAVRDGVVVGTSAVDDTSAIGRHVRDGESSAPPSGSELQRGSSRAPPRLRT